MSSITARDPVAEAKARTEFLGWFQERITPTQLELLTIAYDLAALCHEGEFRESGAPYFTHCLETAKIVRSLELCEPDVEIVIAALLHDSQEKEKPLSLEKIENIFGPRVVSLILAVTKPAKDDPAFASNLDRLTHYFRNLHQSEVAAMIIRMADQLHNMRTLGFCKVEKQRRKIGEVIRFHLGLLNRIFDLDPKAANFFRDEFHKAFVPFEAVFFEDEA